jgi:hypothetical protein
MSIASDMRKLTHMMMMMVMNIDSFQMCLCLDDKHHPAPLQYIALLTSKWSCFNVRYDTVLSGGIRDANCTIYMEPKQCVNMKFKLIWIYRVHRAHI